MTAGEEAAFVASYREAKLWVVLRTNATGTQTDIRVPRFDWNVDQLDVINEGALVDLDPTKTNTYVFRWSAMPGTLCSVGLLHRGQVNWMHEFDSTESADDVPYRLGSASLPLRWELDNRLGLQSASMVQGRGIVSCDGPYDVRGRPFTFDTHVSLTTLTLQQPVPLLSIRLSESRNRGRIQPMRISMMNVDASGTVKYELRLNATLTGDSWTAGESYSFDNAAGTGTQSLSGSGSMSQIDTDATAVSGGLTVVSGYLVDNVTRDLSLDFQDIQLASGISGRPDELTLVGTYIQGSSSVAVALQWTEFN